MAPRTNPRTNQGTELDLLDVLDIESAEPKPTEPKPADAGPDGRASTLGRLAELAAAIGPLRANAARIRAELETCASTLAHAHALVAESVEQSKTAKLAAIIDPGESAETAARQAQERLAAAFEAETEAQDRGALLGQALAQVQSRVDALLAEQKSLAEVEVLARLNELVPAAVEASRAAVVPLVAAFTLAQGAPPDVDRLIASQVFNGAKAEVLARSKALIASTRAQVLTLAPQSPEVLP